MKTKISSFLTERQDRIIPEKANKMGLKRLNKIDFDGNIHITKKPTKTKMILIKPGDLVISGINVEKGAVAVYQGEEDILATIHYSSYEFDKNKINIDYFKWFLESDVFKKAILTQTKGGIKTELKPKKFLPLEINLPPIEKQKEILKKIKSIEKEAEQLNENIKQDKKLLEKLRQSILQKAVQGKLVPQNPKDEPASELLKKIKAEKEKLVKEGKIRKQKKFPPIKEEEASYELPENWEWCRLGEVLEFNYGKGNKENSDSVPAYGSNGILRYCKKALVKKDCIIIGRKGSAGALNIVKGPCWPLDVTYYVTPPENTSFKFIYHLLTSLNLEEIGKGIKPGLNRNEAYAQIIGIPPFQEQKRIVEKVNVLMKMCDELEEKIKESKKYSEKLMDAFLREVFSS